MNWEAILFDRQVCNAEAAVSNPTWSTKLFQLFSQSLSVYVCTYTVMGTKTISITEEAYKALLREKINKESFTDTILRITNSGKISDSFGAWKMTDREEEAIRVELSKGWNKVQERISNEMSRH